jgi:hypothetical protein
MTCANCLNTIHLKVYTYTCFHYNKHLYAALLQCQSPGFLKIFKIFNVIVSPCSLTRGFFVFGRYQSVGDRKIEDYVIPRRGVLGILGTLGD